MGGAVSALTPHQFAQLPSSIDERQFNLITKNTFAKGAFAIIADHEGKMTIDRLKELSFQRDVVFTFEWGIDNKGRSCVRRVQKVADYLVSKGLFICSDDDQNAFIAQSMAGGNKVTARDRVREKMANVQCMVLFLTTRYYQKFMDTRETDNVLKVEFDEFLSKRGARMILPVLFEVEAAIREDSPPPFYELFHHRRVVDLSNFEKEPSQLDDLYEYIIRTITPVREGGDYANRNDNFLSSRLGRYHHWIVEKLPAGTLSHEQAMTYAQSLVNENFDSMARLMQIVLYDDGYLQRLGFDPKHAKMILDAVKADTKDNFDSFSAATITGIMNEKEAKRKSANSNELAAIEKNMETAQMKSEIISMGVEDDHSYSAIQTSYLQSMKQQQFDEKRRKLIEDRMKQRERLHQQIEAFEHAIQVDEEHKERMAWHKEVVHVLQDCHMTELADRFRLLMNRLEENTHAANAGMDGGEDNDWHIEVNANASLIVSSKRNRAAGHRAPSSVDATTPAAHYGSFSRFSMASTSSFSSAAPLVTMTPAKSSRTMIKYGENSRPMALQCKFPLSQDPAVLLEIMQNAALVLRRIEELCMTHGHESVRMALTEGLGKTILLFLTETYIYRCHFLNISLPAQTLSTLSILCRCQPDEATIQEELIFVYSQLGAIEITLSLMKYYVDDRSVLAQAIRFIDRLLTSSVPMNLHAYVDLYIRDPAAMLLLLVAIERFEVEDPTIVIYSAAIVSKLVRSERCDEFIRKSRPTYIIRALNEIIDKAVPSGGCNFSREEMLSIARTMENLYFVNQLAVLPIAAYNTGSGDALERNTLRGTLVSQVNDHVVLPLLMAQITIHAEDAIMIPPLLRCLGNLLYLRHDLKRRVLSLHFPREIMRILKFFQSVLKMGRREERSAAVQVLAEALLTLSNSIDTISSSPLGHSTSNSAMDTATPPSVTTTPVTAMSSKSAASFATPSISTKSAHASHRLDWEKTMQSYLSAGLAEVICDIFDHFQLSDHLLHACLVLLSKLMQGGNTLCSQRLVALGVVDKLGVFLDVHRHPSTALFEMTCQLLLGLTASDDIMVNASRRLIDKTRCEHWIVENMRSMCLAKNTGGHWTHFYSSSIMAEARDGRGGHCCRSCVYCAVLAARLCNHPERGAVMIKRLQTAGLPLLLHAVPIDNANAAAEAVLQSQAVHRLNGSSRGSSHQILGTVQEDSDLEVVINKEKDADGHHELIKGPLNEMEGAVGDFLFPLFTLESGSKELPIPHRAVEYCGNISAHAFDLHVMYLFRQFHLTYGPRTAGEKVFVANVQAVPGALNAAPEPHHPIVD